MSFPDALPAIVIENRWHRLGRPAVRRAAHRAALGSVLALVILAVGIGGLVLRRLAWDRTASIRFTEDIDNAFRQGSRTQATGYVDRYDDEAARPTRNWIMGLDYGPGRLAVATLWARWVRAHTSAPAVGPDPDDQWSVEFYAHARQLGQTYALCRPMLMANLAGEAVSAVAVFWLVRRYTSDQGRRPTRGAVLGAVAVTFFWLDPALVWNAHCWPQWDSWVLPFFLWAVLAASSDRWFCAGLLVAAGAMFKGQTLFGAGLFLLWPVFQGRAGAAVRWAVGAATGVAAATAVWLVRTPGVMVDFDYRPGHVNRAAVCWVLGMAVAFAAAVAVRRARWRPWVRAAVGGGAGLAAVIPLWCVPVSGGWRAAVIGLLAVLFGCAIWPRAALRISRRWGTGALTSEPAPARDAAGGRRWLTFAAAAWVAAALLLCVPVFGDSDQWYFTGIAHGTTARNLMVAGPDSNLPAVLAADYQWQLDDPTLTLPPGRVADATAAFLRAIDRHVRLPPGGPVALPLKYLLIVVWLAAVVACGFGAARHDRRRDARFLVAVAAPWVAMFAVLGQMHQRYLMWGAALTSMAAALNPGLAALHLLLSGVSAGQELLSMAPRDPATANWPIYKLAHGWTPGMGYAVVLTAAAFVYAAVRPGRKS